MTTSRLYDIIVDGYKVPDGEIEKKSYLTEMANFAADELRLKEDPMPMYFRLEMVVGTVEVFYDYGADYYFFRETNDELEVDF